MEKKIANLEQMIADIETKIEVLEATKKTLVLSLEKNKRKLENRKSDSVES